jgi:hypothetical protein
MEAREDAAFRMAIPGTVLAVGATRLPKISVAGKFKSRWSLRQRGGQSHDREPPRDRSRTTSLQVGASFDIVE